MFEEFGADRRSSAGKVRIDREGKGCTPSDRLPRSEVVRVGTALQIDWMVVSGYVHAIPALSGVRADGVDMTSRSQGRLVEVNP